MRTQGRGRLALSPLPAPRDANAVDNQQTTLSRLLGARPRIAFPVQFLGGIGYPLVIVGVPVAGEPLFSVDGMSLDRIACRPTSEV